MTTYVVINTTTGVCINIIQSNVYPPFPYTPPANCIFQTTTETIAIGDKLTFQNNIWWLNPPPLPVLQA